MQEDKKLQSLLTKYAIQEPSTTFDDKVMQLVEASKTTRPVFLISRMLLHTLFGVFITVSILLFLTAAFFIQPQLLPVHFYMPLSLNVYMQLFSFLAAFWIVMLINLWWNKQNRFLTNV